MPVLPLHLAGLRSVRKARGVSREACAELIGVTTSSYDRFETGARRMYLDKAFTLADHLGVSIDMLRTEPDVDLALAQINGSVVIDAATADALGDWVDSADRVLVVEGL